MGSTRGEIFCTGGVDVLNKKNIEVAKPRGRSENAKTLVVSLTLIYQFEIRRRKIYQHSIN